MAEGTPPRSEEDAESPVLTYSAALREGKRIVAKLVELMATPIADIEQPSLVDVTFSSSLSSTPGGAGDVPRRQLFQSPAVQNGAGGHSVCLLDTSNTEHPPSAPAASLTKALDNLRVGDHQNGKFHGPPNHSAVAELAPSVDLEEASQGTKPINSGGLLFNDHELSFLEKRGDGAALTALTVAATPVTESPVPHRDSMPLVYFTPVVPKKPTRGFFAKSDLGVGVNGCATGKHLVPSNKNLGSAVTETVNRAEVDKAAVTATTVVPPDKILNRSLSFVRVPAVNLAEVDEAAPSPPAPTNTAVDRRLSFVVTSAAEPVEADEATAATSPDLPIACNAGDSHANSSETGGEDSFLTAYDSPVHPSRRSFVISRDDPRMLGDSLAAGDRHLARSASESVSAASEDFPVAVAEAEATGGACPESPVTTAYDFTGHPRRRSFVISKDDRRMLGDGLATGDRGLACSASGGVSAVSEDLPMAGNKAEATFACPAPPAKTCAKPRAKASAAANTTVVMEPRKPVSKPIGSTLATRRSLLPPPAASRRPERASAPAKARAPLGRPGGAPNDAEATFTMDPGAPVAPPVGAAKVASRLQPKKQEPPSVRPKFATTRAPVSTPATVAASPASRQSMPAPGGASGAMKRPASARRSVVVPKTAVPPAPSVASRAPVRPPAPTNGAASGARASRLSTQAGPGEVSKERVQLPKPPLANGKPNPEPRGEQAAKAQLRPSRLAAPKTRVPGGFSRLPTMAGSSAASRAALLAPVPESPSARLSSTPVRDDHPPPSSAACPELTPIRRQ